MALTSVIDLNSVFPYRDLSSRCLGNDFSFTSPLAVLIAAVQLAYLFSRQFLHCFHLGMDKVRNIAWAFVKAMNKTGLNPSNFDSFDLFPNTTETTAYGITLFAAINVYFEFCLD